MSHHPDPVYLTELQGAGPIALDFRQWLTGGDE